MSTCPGCGAEMRTIPAGIAKVTGKPYEAFEACSAKCGFKLTQKPGFKSIVVESQKPSQVPHPTNGNDGMFKCCAMNGAVKVVSKIIEVGLSEPGDKGNQIINLYRSLLSEMINPLR